MYGVSDRTGKLIGNPHRATAKSARLFQERVGYYNILYPDPAGGHTHTDYSSAAATDGNIHAYVVRGSDGMRVGF